MDKQAERWLLEDQTVWKAVERKCEGGQSNHTVASGSFARDAYAHHHNCILLIYAICCTQLCIHKTVQSRKEEYSGFTSLCQNPVYHILKENDSSV